MPLWKVSRVHSDTCGNSDIVGSWTVEGTEKAVRAAFKPGGLFVAYKIKPLCSKTIKEVLADIKRKTEARGSVDGWPRPGG